MFSPEELLMSCCLHANLPLIQSQLQPSAPNLSLLKAKEKEKKRNQKRVFDSQHAVHDLDPLYPVDEVWVPDHNITYHVIVSHDLDSLDHSLDLDPLYPVDEVWVPDHNITDHVIVSRIHSYWDSQT